MKTNFTELEPFRQHFEQDELKSLNSEPGQREGAFVFLKGEVNLSVLVQISDGWEHVSVAGQTMQMVDNEMKTQPVMPTWDDMSAIKAVFFEEEETVIQIHPPRSMNASAHDCTLHLWRPTGKVEFPLPPESLVNYTSDLWQPVEDVEEPIPFKGEETE